MRCRKAPWHYKPASRCQGSHHGYTQAVDMINWQNTHAGIGFVQLMCSANIASRCNQIGMRQQNPFWHAGGSRCVHQQANVVGVWAAQIGFVNRGDSSFFPAWALVDIHAYNLWHGFWRVGHCRQSVFNHRPAIIGAENDFSFRV